MPPTEAIDEIQDPVRFLQLPVQQGGVVRGVDGPEVVDEDVEAHPVAAVVGGSEGAEAAAEGADAVEGEELDGEGEALIVRVRVRVRGVREVEGGVVVVGVKEDDGEGDDKEEGKEGSPFWVHLGLRLGPNEIRIHPLVLFVFPSSL